MKCRLLVALCSGVMMLSACAVGPDYLRPTHDAQRISSYLNEPDVTASEFSISRWWERIDDPLLTSYIDQLFQENLALEQGAERVIQAQEQVNIAGGSFFPTLGVDLGASRNFSSANSFNTAGSGGRTYVTSYNADVSSSWQIDLFGRLRRSLQSAKANFEASQYDQQALVHSLIAELVTRRVSIATNQHRLELAKNNVENRKGTYDLVKNRYNLGVMGTSAADVYLAEENYRTVQGDMHAFERALSEDVYRLDVLLGQIPGTTDPFKTVFPLLPSPLDVAVCVPAALVDRRPDLRASELRLAAATANIGVAVADIYPSLNLGASIGFSGNDFGNLFRADQLAGTILGNLTARLFEGGRLKANIRLKESLAREQAAGYAEDILNALREVETALKSETELQSELTYTMQSVDALRRAEEISKDRYLRGILTLQSFLDIQQRRYSIEQGLLGIQQEKWNARIALYLALGGDWKHDKGICE